MAVQRNHRQPGLVTDAKGMANQAQSNIWVDRLTRIGYFTRGIIYGLIGLFALQLVFGRGGKLTDQSGALASLASQPFGKFLLIIVAIGLVGLFIWGLIRAVADPLRKGHDFKGIVARIGYLISGLSYGALLIPTLNAIQGAGRQSAGSTQSAQKATASILAMPGGQLIVSLVGLILIGVGIFRIYSGYKGRLNERLKSYQMTQAQRQMAIRLGRLGYVALGIVFLILGGLAILAAMTLDPKKVGGVDQALTFLARQPYGPYLLFIVALGLLAYAVYSFMGSIWFKIKEL